MLWKKKIIIIIETWDKDLNKILNVYKTNGKYLKPILIVVFKNYSASIDFFSQCTLVRKSVADESDSPLTKTALPVFKDKDKDNLFA